MKKNSKFLKAVLAFLCVAVVIEIFGFNSGFFTTLKNKEEGVSLTASESIKTADGKTFTLPEYSPNGTQEAYFEIKDINKNVNTLYLDLTPSYKGELNGACFDVYMMDEGHSGYYFCTSVKLHPSYEKTKYIRLHSYGRIKSIKLNVLDGDYSSINTEIKSGNISLNPRVPMFFSVIRVLLIIILLTVIYMFRPSSSLYLRGAFDEGRRLRLLRLLFMTANIGIVAFLIINNLTFANPSNAAYRQYNLLAEAICSGRLDIEVPHGELMKEVASPYDYFARQAVLQSHGIFVEREPWWDVAYFGGKFYVYFGIVPALIFFIPVYAIFKTHMIMSAAVLIVCSLIVVVSYAFVDTLISIYFRKTSFGVRLFSLVILANCTGVVLFSMLPTIYYIVILMSILFVMAGLMLWMKAAELLKNGEKAKKALAEIAAGSLCMALVAGCRPQFLLASVLIIPIFKDVAFRNKRLVIKGNISKYLSVAIPYAVVAAGLMYYNYARFGSPFDFGANYNLTTNNMPLRGFNLARLKDGLFAIIAQPPSMSMRFPFVLPVEFFSDYVGKTVRENTYGGVLFTACYILFLFMLRRVKPQLKEKKLYTFVILCILISFVTACADIELSAILTRYIGDFLYLLIIGSIMVMLALYEKEGHKKQIVFAMLALTFITLFFAFFASFNHTTFAPGSTEGYYRIYSLFT